MYLENFLRALDPNANVQVYTEDMLTMSTGQQFQRCLGNHFIKNWERGLVGMQRAFEVIKAELGYVDEGVPTWRVVVRCPVANWVRRLERTSNNAACFQLYHNEEVV